MKKIIVILSAILLFSECATIPGKNILLIYNGLGVDVYYKSTACQDKTWDPAEPAEPAWQAIPAGQVTE